MIDHQRAHSEKKQREIVRLRAGNKCQLERFKDGKWHQCAKFGWHTAHVIPRRHCGKLKYDPRVAINACAECHLAYDGHQDGIRVTPDTARMVWALLVQETKSPLPGRYNPDAYNEGMKDTNALLIRTESTMVDRLILQPLPQGIGCANCEGTGTHDERFPGDRDGCVMCQAGKE